MTETRVQDIIVPEVYAPYALEMTREKSQLWASGILSNDARLNLLASQGGVEVNIPFFKALEGEDEVLSDSSPLTVNNITTGVQKAHVLQRGKAWGVNDLAKSLSGADPVAAIAAMEADYWNSKYQNSLLSCLNGIYEPTGAGASLVFSDGTVDASTGNMFSASTLIDGENLLSDSSDGLVALYMHTDVYNRLKKQNLIQEEIADPAGTAGELLTANNYIGSVDRMKKIGMMDGMRVIAEKNANLVANATTGGGKVYKTYAFKANSVGLGDANAPVPVEFDRDKLAGIDIMIRRRHYVIHPYGFSFSASAGADLAGLTPTNAELATVAKWSKATADDRNIGIVCMRTNG